MRQHADAEQTSKLIHNQITAADIVLLNKIDLVDSTRRTETASWIRQLVPEARLLETVQCDAPLELLFGLNLGSALDRLPPVQPHEHTRTDSCSHTPSNHTATFSTWSYESERPFRLHQVRAAMKSLPATIFRAKGILSVVEASRRRTIFQLVGSRFTLITGAPWDNTPPLTRMVFIGTENGIDAAELQRRFDACLVEKPGL